MAIDFKTLGCYGVYPPYGKACNGYLFGEYNKQFIVDFGFGCMSKLLGVTREFNNIECIILTHLHYDHMSDIFAMGYYLQKNNAKITVILPQTPVEISSLVAKMNCFNIVILNENLNINIGNLNVTASKSVHSVETYSIIIRRDQDKMVYTSDIEDSAVLKILAVDATEVIGDAGTPQYYRNKGVSHIGVTDLANAVPKEAKLYLGHLREGMEDEILLEALIYHTNTVLLNE